MDPSIFNEFAAFAFRFGHSLVPIHFSPSNKPQETVRNICPLKDTFYNFEEFVLGQDLSGKAWQNVILGISKTQSPPMDSKIEPSLTNFLFCGDHCDYRKGFGQDLVARNIQRAHLPARSKVNILTSIEVSYMVETVLNSRFQK